MPSQSIFEIQANLCRTMSNPVRLKIVYVLHDGPKRVADIAQLTEYPPETISRHLNVLRNGWIVTARRNGQDVIYQIANPKIVEICDLMREVLAEESSRRFKLIEGMDEDEGVE